MTVITSSSFASSVHGGATWREAAKQVLDDLSDVMTEDHTFTLGFVYVTDHLAADVGAIINLFQSVLGIKNWVGSIGIAVCGADKIYTDEIGIAAMITRMEADDFAIMKNPADHTEWITEKQPVLVLSHAHPHKDYNDFDHNLKMIEEQTNGFLLGGVSLCRPDKIPDKMPVHDAINTSGGIDTIAFAGHVKIASMMSQGCKPIGEMHTITRCDGVMIKALDGMSPQDVFENDLKNFATNKIGENPDNIIVEDADTIPDEYKAMFQGEVMTAFSLPDTDTNEMIVRPILGINDNGTMMVQHHCEANERMMFVHRDDVTVAEDLSVELLNLRKRITHEYGELTNGRIKGGIYISCAARAFTDNGAANTSEINLIRDILGEFPLAGFYSGGEIKGTRMYAFTGILIIFL